MVKHKFSCTQNTQTRYNKQDSNSNKNTNNKGKKNNDKDHGGNRSRIDLWDNYTYM